MKKKIKLKEEQCEFGRKIEVVKMCVIKWSYYGNQMGIAHKMHIFCKIRKQMHIRLLFVDGTVMVEMQTFN